MWSAIGETKAVLDLIEMAVHMQSFDDIRGCRLIQIELLNENGIGLLLGEGVVIRNGTCEGVECFLGEWWQ
ncbi:hypothetical protein SAMN05421858_4480 [Haladaptatus litoreus]|uniref:Uncharacterized protein n=1 Tax=Haladaptatus litoreus TaxID=553468 RepID=A0A1N7ETH0_9EURY|nr:hypothetical protein SAMN05421858_4480 [Haladaptatus litoreus]